MRLEIELSKDFILQAKDVESYKRDIRIRLLINDFDLSKPISMKMNYDKLSISYFQDRDDI